jgi:hypothetical protein
MKFMLMPKIYESRLIIHCTNRLELHNIASEVKGKFMGESMEALLKGVGAQYI